MVVAVKVPTAVDGEGSASWLSLHLALLSSGGFPEKTTTAAAARGAPRPSRPVAGGPQAWLAASS